MARERERERKREREREGKRESVCGYGWLTWSAETNRCRCVTTATTFCNNLFEVLKLWYAWFKVIGRSEVGHLKVASSSSFSRMVHSPSSLSWANQARLYLVHQLFVHLVYNKEKKTYVATALPSLVRSLVFGGGATIRCKRLIVLLWYVCWRGVG